MTKKKGAGLEEEEAATRAKLFEIIGDAPIPRKTIDVPTASLVVDAKFAALPVTKRRVSELAESFTNSRAGMLHPPSVVPLPNTQEGEARYRVIAGRKRTLAALRCGYAEVEVHVYTCPNESAERLITLAENLDRYADWCGEVQIIAELIEEGTAMTAEMLVLGGIPKERINAVLDMARLPRPLIDLIAAGELNQVDAKRITRVSREAQERIADAATQGEKIDSGSIREILNRQQTPTFVSLLCAEEMPATPVADATEAAGIFFPPSGTGDGTVQVAAPARVSVSEDLDALSGICQRLIPYLVGSGAKSQLALILKTAAALVPIVAQEVNRG